MLQKLVDEQEEHQNSRSSGDFIYIYSRNNNKKPRSSFFSVVVISTVIMSSVLVLLLLAMTVVPWSSQKILNEDRSRMESSVVQFLIHDELAAEDFKGADDDDTDPAVNAQGFVQVDEYYDNEEGVRNDNEGSRRGSLSPQEESQLWAVLVAGSNGFYNYRHQADVCHAYQILRRNGVPPENIIVMMYDDIANNSANPKKGIVINRPNGTDVYQGVIIDYAGDDVTPENFKKVLLGEEEGLKGVGSGKVLKSGPNDHVFINFVDHGAPGLVAFPNDELHASELKEVLKQMHVERKFAKLVFYLEACESGSMFKHLLPAHWNIFATTAANAEESSYACYYDDSLGTYLGDVYSVMWMENADSVDLTKETLQRQFAVVRNETNTSHVQEFGDRSLRKLPVSEFLGESDSSKLMVYPPVPLDPVPVGDVVRTVLERKLERAGTAQERREIKLQLGRLHKMRKLVTNVTMDIIGNVTRGDASEKAIILNNRFPLIDLNCYETAARFFSRHCFSIAKNSFVTRKLYLLVNICERGWPTEKILQVMSNTCQRLPSLTGIN